MKENASKNCGLRLEKKDWNYLYRDSELDGILLLLKAFPVHRKSFKQSLAAFIIHSDVRFIIHGYKFFTHYTDLLFFDISD